MIPFELNWPVSLIKIYIYIICYHYIVHFAISLSTINKLQVSCPCGVQWREQEEWEEWELEEAEEEDVEVKLEEEDKEEQEEDEEGEEEG